ncbi:MAG: methyltransferase domain-containing protein [Deltaproteobacteria bacterium]|nr:methyltransferase domain-containing protein [Deltaproteobacteria bacterium]
MKPRLLSFLVCPGCKQELELADHSEADGEILEGILACRPCRSDYPIRKGIPRFVERDAYVDTFSFEWNKFHDVQIDILNATDESENTFHGKTGWTPGDLKGKLVLDVGVGAGRFTEVVSRWGGEVVGIDLSFAVDAAFENIGRRENVHIVQADLFHLPFAASCFEAMYSIGVLHHTPDTRKAFESVVPLLKTGGDFAVFVYAYGHYSYFSDIWRKITTRVPYRLLYYLTALSVPLYYIYEIPLVGLGFRFVFPMSRHPNPRWRWLDTFDWYTPRYQHKHTWPEVYQWYLENGFIEIKLNQESRDYSLLHVNVRGRKREE